MPSGQPAVRPWACSGPGNVIGNEPFCAAAVYFLLHSEPFVSYRKNGLSKNPNFYAANPHHFCSKSLARALLWE